MMSHLLENWRVGKSPGIDELLNSTLNLTKFLDIPAPCLWKPDYFSGFFFSFPLYP